MSDMIQTSLLCKDREERLIASQASQLNHPSQLSSYSLPPQPAKYPLITFNQSIMTQSSLDLSKVPNISNQSEMVAPFLDIGLNRTSIPQTANQSNLPHVHLQNDNNSGQLTRHLTNNQVNSLPYSLLSESPIRYAPESLVNTLPDKNVRNITTRDARSWPISNINVSNSLVSSVQESIDTTVPILSSIPRSSNLVGLPGTAEIIQRPGGPFVTAVVSCGKAAGYPGIKETTDQEAETYIHIPGIKNII